MVCALHVRDDLIPFLKKFEGIPPGNIFVTGPYYGWEDSTAEVLRSRGINMFKPNAPGERAVTDCARIIFQEIEKAMPKPDGSFIIIEDGGYFVPLLHYEEFQGLIDYCKGAVEQTTQGITRDTNIQGGLKIPVVSIPSSRVKSNIEPKFVARAVYRNLEVILYQANHMMDSFKYGIIGIGTIGLEIVEEFHKQGIDLIACDTDPERLSAVRRINNNSKVGNNKSKDVEITGDSIEVCSNCDVAIGATGRDDQFTIGRDQIDAGKNGIMLASASSKQIEIDINYIRNMSKLVNTIYDPKGVIKYIETYKRDDDHRDIHLIGEGQPLNFLATFSVPMPVIETVYALMLACSHMLVNVKLREGFLKFDKPENKKIDLEIIKLWKKYNFGTP